MLNKDKKHYSYSGLKRFIEEGPSSLITEKHYSNKGMSKGIILEDMLILPDFEDKYYISEDDIGTLTSMERKLLDAKVERPNKDYQYLREDLGFFKGDNDTKFKSRVKEIDKFYEGYKESKDKIFIKKDLWSNVFTMSNALKYNDDISLYFNNDNITNFQNIYQKTIIFDYKGRKFKCILDIIHIDKIDKTIQSVDLKYTHVKMNMFEREFYKYRYDIQACLYSLSLNQFIEDNNLEGYKILEPAYIVVNDNLETCRFIIDNSILSNAWNGYEFNGFEKNGIYDLCNEIKWHIDNKVFNMSKFNYEHEYVKIKSNNHNYYGSFENIQKFKSKKDKESEKAILSKYKNPVENIKISYSSNPFSSGSLNKTKKGVYEQIIKYADAYQTDMLEAQQKMLSQQEENDLNNEKKL